MRLLCPNCQQSFVAPDAQAGQVVYCPECGQKFPAPQLYAPPTRVDPLPTASVPEVPRPRPSAAEPAPAPTFAEAGPAGRTMVLKREVVRWVPPGVLTAIFVLTFFSWNGLFPANYSAYTQSAWGGLFAGLSVDPVAEKAMGLEGDLRENLHTSWWLLPYLLAMFPTLLIAWAGPVLDALGFKLPPAVQSLWHLRPMVLGGLAIFLLLVLMAQWASGFGLQRAVTARVEETHAAERAAAKTSEDNQIVEMKIARDRGTYHVRTTPWLRLVVLLHLVLATAVVLEMWLEWRGPRPAPRLTVSF